MWAAKAALASLMASSAECRAPTEGLSDYRILAALCRRRRPARIGL